MKIVCAILLLLPLAHAAEPVRENIEWLDVWLPETNSTGLPRVLLIGDSIVRGYGKQVETLLKGQAFVGRMATSKSLGDPALIEEVSLVLRQQSFQVVHFNNGMHGDGYTEPAYAAALPELITTIRRLAPKAKLVWASTTDVREKGNLDRVAPKTKRVVMRNELAREIARREKIPVNDLFAVVRDHPEYHGTDGVHFNEKGNTALAAQVAAEVAKALR
jgi:lysophospholipase L1-like esterase